MSRITNCENLSATLVGLLILVILVTGSVGCASQVSGQLSSDDTNVFLPDRVAEVRIVMKEELWNDLQSNAKEEEYYLVDLWFDGELVPDVAVRAKGSSSLVYVVKDGSNRLSLKVDINLFNDMRTFHGLKKLNYHNCYRDPTLMREKLAYDLFAQMGVPASRTSHVDLWVNDTHLGLYLQVEQVDKAFLRRHFPQNCEGNLYKPIPPASFLNWAKGDIEETQTDLESDPNDINIGGGNLSDIVGAFGHGQTTGSPTVSTATPSGSTDATVSNEFSYLRRMRLKTNEKRADHSALLRFLDVLNNEPDKTFPEEIEKVLDVDEALRFIAVETILVSLDSYLGRGLNYYLYEIDGKFMIIPWDLNESFGTYKCDIPRDDVLHFFIDEPTCGPTADRPLVGRLLAHKPYLDTYHGYLKELLEGPFSVESMGMRIDETANLIRPFVENDELKFYPTEDFETNLNDRIGRYFGLKPFVAERGESVRMQLAGELPSRGDIGAGNSGDPDEP